MEELQIIETHIGQLERVASVLMQEHPNAVQRVAEGIQWDPKQRHSRRRKALSSWVGVCPGNEARAERKHI
ncbi:hypothetical protein SBA3_1960007 [Candidatus Sulfopaludibacter sp. SbA3]|nr:hypothetical protein SBA3_1960007 [Candidatus Sulfopaludibacter sp. SbA3]